MNERNRPDPELVRRFQENDDEAADLDAEGPAADAGTRPVTPPPHVAKKKKVQSKLDDALEASFPASDPVSIVTSNAEEDWDAEPKGCESDPAGGTERRPDPR